MDGNLKNKVIVVGVTGSIAAYKSADIVSQLNKMEAEVFVVMTREAREFITPMTLQTLSRNPVSSDLWEEGNGWQPGHIDLADKADVLLVAPATANIISCFAHGLAPDLISSIYLATLAQVVIAPAMNSKMLSHPATQYNLKILTDRGNIIIEPDQGMLACGYEGKGKLSSVETIISVIESCCSQS